MTMYKVIGSDGNEFGPASEETVRTWLAQGRLTVDSKVKAEGTAEWRRLGDLPQFAVPPTPVTHATVPPTPTPAPVSGLAIASLVLGVLGLITAGLAAIPGLILGIIALVKINKSQGRLQGTGVAIAGISVSGVFLLLLPIMAAMLLPALGKAKMKAQSVQCMNNMKQLNLALMMYATDHQDQFPSADKWCDLIKPYLGGSDAAFRCAAQQDGRCSYAFNANLAGQKTSDVSSPAQTILVFSSADGWNQSGGKAMLKMHSHGNVFTYGFADGHVEIRRPGTETSATWDLPAKSDR